MTREDILVTSLIAFRQSIANSDETDSSVKRYMVEDEELDLIAIKQGVHALVERGWEDNDILRYMRVMEHVNPTFEEEYALEIMSALNAKYLELRTS